MKKYIVRIVHDDAMGGSVQYAEKDTIAEADELLDGLKTLYGDKVIGFSIYELTEERL